MKDGIIHMDVDVGLMLARDTSNDKIHSVYKIGEKVQ